MDILETNAVVTRKEHQCFTCIRKFPSGTEMQYQVVVDSGVFHHTYMCKTCIRYNFEVAKQNTLEERDFECPIGDKWDDIRKEVES